MKKCHYCAKEIDYSEMYCSADCEEKANAYYRKRLKCRIPANIIYIAGTALFALGVFFSPIFTFWGLLGVAVGGISTGVTTILLPSPTEEMIKKHKMVKAQKIFKICGTIITSVGVIALIMAIVKLFV